MVYSTLFCTFASNSPKYVAEDMDERLMYEHCEAVYNEISNVVTAFAGKLEACPDIARQLFKTKNRAMEYKSGSYIIIVVGPVKSGKSTLVNLIARSYVSPTHFLECTVRPSIISQKRPGEQERIVVYSSKGMEDKVELIDAIIDNIRGMGQGDTLSSIKSETFPLTPEMVKTKVEMDLRASNDEQTLLTSIATPGGLLMQQDVFIIDMPGFDGGKANIDNPVYDTIAQRADLVIFVQSSNSAISKVSGQFLSMLSRNNKDVPVCLIHNVFESAWWRPLATREENVKNQMQFAIEEIRRQGFNIHESLCYCINLGKVEDALGKGFEGNEMLQQEKGRFEEMEKVLRNRVINHRDAMRLKVCMGRTQTQLQHLMEMTNKELERRKALKEEYRRAMAVFEEIAPDHLLKEARLEVNCDLEGMKTIVSNEITRRIDTVQDNLHLMRSEVRELLDDAVDNCEQRLATNLDRLMGVQLIEKEMELLYRQRLDEISGAAIKCGQTPAPHTPVHYTIGELPEVSLGEAIGKCLTLPRKLFIPGINYGGHGSEDLVGYLRAVGNFLVGSKEEGNDGYRGFLETTAMPPVVKEMEARIEQVRQSYAKDCDIYYMECKSKVSDNIIPDIDAFDRTTNDLSLLYNQTSNINLRP